MNEEGYPWPSMDIEAAAEALMNLRGLDPNDHTSFDATVNELDEARREIQ